MKRQQSFSITENHTIDPRKILSERVDFQSEIEKMRGKWKITVHYFISKDQENILKEKEFNSDIRKLIQKIKIDKNLIPFITEYIFLDMAVFEYTEGHTISIYEGNPPKKENPSYFLELTEKTTKKDILNIWDKIETFIHGDNKPEKKKKEWKTFKRDRSIYRLAKMGYSAFQIEEYINTIYKNKEPLNTEALLKAESRYRDKMKISGSNNISLSTFKNKKVKDNFFLKTDPLLISCFIEED